MPQISQVYGIPRTNIRRWMERYNIPSRSSGEGSHLVQGNHCEISSGLQEYLDGELLGDGGLFSHSQYSATFSYCSKHLEYLKYVKNTLLNYGVRQSGNIITQQVKRVTGDKLDADYYYYQSLCYAEFLPYYERWYPNGKKSVPKDIKLTVTTLKFWYIGDGTLIHAPNSRDSIRLCTMGFSIPDVKFLVTQLSELGFKVTHQPAHNTILISTESTLDFLTYLQGSPVDCYKYKWDYQDNRKQKT
mgnify:CR=1 FL=1